MARKLTVLEILLIVFVLIVLAIDVLLLYLVLENPDTSFVPVCPESVPESERIDCAPGKEVTENICTQKYKCCWKLASSAQVPKCFFPQNWGYKISDPPDNTSTNYIARLEKLPSPSLFGEDVTDTRFTAEFQTSNRFHFKITDFYNARYEVPHENVKLLNQTTRADNANANYHLEVTDNPFSFKLKRKSNSKVLLDTSIGPLQFAQQYLQLSFRLPSANVYGLGEHVHQQYRHSMTWKTWPIFTSNTRPTEDMKNLYGAHTFFLCLEDTSGNSFGVFLMNSNAMEVTLQPAPAITYRTSGGILDFYVFLGNTPEQVVQEYLEVVGRPFMPSYWNLGFQLSRRDYGGIEGLKKVINRNQEAMIPYDVQYFDIDYMNEGKDFTIDENKFPDLLNFITILRQQGLKCVMIMHPGISNDSNYQPYERGNKKGVWIRENNNFIVGQGYPGWTVFPDYSNPSGVEWWKEEFISFSETLKFDGVWIEMNELSSFLPSSSQTCEENILNNPPFVPQSMRPLLYEGTICMDAEFYEEFHYNLHSLYGYFMTKATDLALKNISGEKRNFILSRSTFAGSGKFAGHWLGNNAASWNDIRWSIPSILEFNLFGIPLVGANICGYLQSVTEELCRRWMQLGAFYPLARNHNGPGFRDQDPAAFGNNSTLVASSKHYLSIRYTLLPYLYTLFYRAHTLGETVARPLVHEFYQDPETWGIHEQFMWGPGLLITPVLYEGVNAVKAYIPDAIWYDYETGVAMQSRKQLVEMKLRGDQIGLHLRGGYIFPTQEPDVNTKKSRHRPLGLIIALDHKREAKGELYWDDGESKDAVTNKLYILYEFSVTSNHLQATIINNNYSSVILNFTYFKFLGMDKKPSNFTISSNGMQITNGNITYNASTKVLEIDVQIGLTMGNNFSIKWSFSVDNLEKFNCFPEEPNVSSDNCINRGCLWEHTGEAGVPLCYYDTIPKYAATNIQYLPEGITTQLTYLTPPESAPVVPPSPPLSQAMPPPLTTAASGPLSEEVRVLNVKVIYHTQSILQFKIYDPNNKRYEVPVPLNTPSSPVNCSKDCLYEVKIQNNPFGIQIRRKGSGTVIWDSQLPGFTFNDKFLSISTRLPSQYIYGLGENEHTSFSKNMNWTTWGMFARDEPPEYRTNSYGVHPYYMALEMDGSAHGVLLLNSNAMDVTLQPTPALTFRTTGGILDFYMVLGPTPELVTQQYTELIGRPAMVPYWALGFQLGRRGYQNDAEIYNLYKEMMASRIPYDVQHVDVDYMDRKLGFTISPKFRNLEHFIWRMKSDGMRFIIILNPAISGNETQYLTFTRGKENDVFIKWPDSSDIVWGKALPDLPNVNGNESLDHESQMYKAHVAFPDFFRNSTAAWWKKEIQELYTNPLDPEKSLKFDGLWIDMNEPTNFVNGSISSCKDEILNKPPYMPYLASRDSGLSIKTLCMESQQTLPDGSLVQHYNVHSLYGWSQARPTFEAVQEVTGQRGVVITRSTFPSSGRWGGYWLGDNMSKWDQLKKSIIGMMEFSLFGIPYTGANICGFLGEAEYEMCIRWMQLGAFYPFSRNHNTIGTRRQDPVAWDTDFMTMSREVLQTRYKLLPYLYTLMHKAHAEGSTVVRPLLHEFMNDTMTWKIDEQFMLGPAILISPVLQSNTSKINAYFPKSRWLDYYTETLIESVGERKVLEAPLNRINLHVRAGYIVPWQEPGMNTYLSRQQVMGLIIVLNENLEAEGEMFWDDGQSIDAYEKGDYYLAKFLAQNNTLKIQTTHNNYLSASNPLKFGHITIWGIESTLVTRVKFTYDNQQFVEDDFQCDPNKQKLSINLSNNISLEKLKEVIWIYGDSPPVTPTPIPPVITTTPSSLSPPVTTFTPSPPVTTTPIPPVITTTHSSLSPPVTTITPSPPVTTTPISPVITTTPRPSGTSTTQMTNTISTSPLYSSPFTTEDTTVEWYPGSTTEIKPTSTAGTRSPPPATASVFPTQTTEATTIPTAATTTTTIDTTVDLTSTTITDKSSIPITTTSTITATTPTTTSITDTSAVATSTTIYATTVTKNTSTFSPTTITSSTNATSTIMTTMTDPASTTNHDTTTSTPKVSNTDTIASPNPTLPMTTNYFPTSNTEDTTNTNTSEITTTTINNTLSTSLSTDSISPITNSHFPETSSEVATILDPNVPFPTLFRTSNTAVPNTTPATNTPMTTNTNAATVANLTTTINSFSTSTIDISISDATPTVDVNTISTALSDSTFPVTSNLLPPSSTDFTNSTTVSDTFSTSTTEITMAVTNTTANTSSTSTTASNNFPVTTSSFPNFTKVTATTKVSDTTTHIVNTFATTLSTDSRSSISITNSTFSANITGYN